MQEKMSSVTIPVMMTRKMKRASTLPAIVEARSGHNGKLLNMSLTRCSRFWVRLSSWQRAFQSEHDEQESAQNQNRRRSRQAQNVGDDGAVLSARRIIVVAVEQHLIDRIANLPLRRFDQAHPQILGWKIHTIEVARDATLRSQHHDRGRVRELVDLRIVLILEAYRPGQRVDGIG